MMQAVQFSWRQVYVRSPRWGQHADRTEPAHRCPSCRRSLLVVATHGTGIAIPRTCVTSILDHQPPKRWSFPIKTEVKWALGIHIHLPSFTYAIHNYSIHIIHGMAWVKKIIAPGISRGWMPNMEGPRVAR